jgi:hypothetical protein
MKRPEEALHRAIVTHLRARLEPPWMVWHTPNGGGRSKAEAGILKALGVTAGMPDLFVLGPNRNLIGIEIKAPPKQLPSGRTSAAKAPLSEAQKLTIGAFCACGVPVIVVRDLDDAIASLSTLGARFRGRVM